MQSTAISIIKKLKSKGFKAYLAGGCVRDMLLGIEPKDYDIATSAKPEEIEDIFPKTYAIGKKFGVMHVYEGKYHYEVATFREDRGYEDKRRPDKVFFKSPKEDALRRDFTINALFMDVTQPDPKTKYKVIDYVDGQKDLKEKLVKFVGNAEKRLDEDSLRLLRAVRFVNQIEGGYHPDTYKAVQKHAHEISNVSQERIRDELNKMLLLKNRDQCIEELYETGILKYILPELVELKGVPQPTKYHKEGDVWEHTKKCIRSLRKPSLTLVWAVLLHDIAKPQTYKYDGERIRFDGHAELGGDIAKKILTRLKFPNKFINDVVWLVEHHMMLHSIIDMQKARQITWFQKPLFKKLLAVEKADSKGTSPTRLEMYKKVKKLRETTLSKLPKKIEPLLSGKEIMKISGLNEGKEIGKLKEKLYHMQLEGKFKTKVSAIKQLKLLID